MAAIVEGLGSRLPTTAQPGWPGLHSITFTGLDEQLPWSRWLDMAHRYPVAEWGVLYSKQRAGQDPRYPSLAWIQGLEDRWPSGVRRALHLCGSAVHDWIAGDPQLRALAMRFDRLQLNLVADRTDLAALRYALETGAHGAVITQHHDRNRRVTEALAGLHNHALLFDRSGGRGQVPDGWPAPWPDRAVGYAGGLGPETILEQIRRIELVTRGRPYWLDMEQALRNALDQFDLALVLEALRRLGLLSS